jgi:hypothetical protein
MNLREVAMKNGLVVFIRHDSAEIWGLGIDGLTLGIGSLKIMASTDVFMRLVFTLS